MIQGLTGKISGEQVAVEAASTVALLPQDPPSQDLDLQRMADWAMNYLIRTPRPEFNYEPVFQCHPLKCPPVPARHDVVVPCDTDARMEWEWYYLRDITYPLLAFTQEVAGLWTCRPDLKIKFSWLGNMVVSSNPAPVGTPLFTGKPRQLPNPPATPESLRWPLESEAVPSRDSGSARCRNGSAQPRPPAATDAKFTIQ